MSKLSDMFSQEVSRQASKAAVDAVWAQGDGTDAYNLCGKIILGCGFGWVLISIIPFACKVPLGEMFWVFILAAIHIIAGALLIVLSKKSKRFQQWADKDFEKGMEKRKKLEEKAKIGNITLPFSNGDILALKILGVIFAIIFIILGIGILQGWVK